MPGRHLVLNVSNGHSYPVPGSGEIPPQDHVSNYHPTESVTVDLDPPSPLAGSINSEEELGQLLNDSQDEGNESDDEEMDPFNDGYEGAAATTTMAASMPTLETSSYSDPLTLLRCLLSLLPTHLSPLHPRPQPLDPSQRHVPLDVRAVESQRGGDRHEERARPLVGQALGRHALTRAGLPNERQGRPLASDRRGRRALSGGPLALELRPVVRPDNVQRRRRWDAPHF